MGVQKFCVTKLKKEFMAMHIVFFSISNSQWKTPIVAQFEMVSH